MDKVKLGDICDLKSSKRIFESEYVESGIPFVRGLEISDGTLKSKRNNYECYISRERYEELKDSVGVPGIGDVLITAVGTIGNLYLVEDDYEFYFKDGNVIWLSNLDKSVIPEYLFYFLQSPYFKKQLEYALIGAVQKALTIVMLKEIEVILPEIDEQRRIASLLSNLDNKIANNQKLIKELEDTARLIYDYWFTQFDFPDENGKPYRSSSGKMVWNDVLKREIPEGWEVGCLGDYVEVVRGVSYDPEDLRDSAAHNSTALYRANNISNGLINSDSVIYVDNKCISKNQMLTEASIFMCMSSGSKEHVGKTAIVPSDLDVAFGAFCSKIEPRRDYLGYLDLFIRGDYFDSVIKQRALGTNINNVTAEMIQDVKLPIPSIQLSQDFNKLMKPFLRQYGNLSKENEELIKLRDWLLPTLMNGQAKVS